MEPSKKKNLSVDVGVITSLGRNSIKDHTTAILELIKNSYDAGSTLVDVDILSHMGDPYIRIADNGCGMTEKEIDNYWLRIGYSEKRENRYFNGRRKTGEKGIGRLSADRLGSILEMRSRTPKDGDISIIFNWDSFNQIGRNIEEVKFDFFDEGVQIDLPKIAYEDPEPISGTELIIKGLRQIWIPQDFEDLHKQLSMFISPLSEDNNFIIRLITNQNATQDKINVSKFGKYFEVKFKGRFDPATRILSYDIWERKPGSSRRIKKVKQGISLEQLLTITDETDSLLEKPLGPINLTLLYYPRNEKTIIDSGFKLSELSDYLKENAGIRLYRDNVRVKPYGELDSPGGDWLNLGSRFAQNPAGRGRSNHRIRPSQLIGAIFIGRDDNPELNDSASREGLIQGDSFRLLREFVIGCIRLVEARSHEIFIQEEALSISDEESIDRDLDTINKKLVVVRDDLLAISKTLNDKEDAEVKLIGESIASIVCKIDFATESIEVLESQTRLYRGLATIGIASAVFGHETQTQLSRMIGAMTMSKDYLLKSPPQIQNSVSKINTALDASERVNAWGGFALDRIRRDKRERTKENISEIIQRITKDLNRAFVAVDIFVDDNEIDKTIYSRVFQIDIESIILNLLTNAYTACKQVKKNRHVKINLNKSTKKKQKGYCLTVSDSGPGVNEKLRSIIWEPTFTTKTVKKGASEEGTGMGLAIIDGIVEEMKGTRYVGDDSDLGGARFEIWLPIVQ